MSAPRGKVSARDVSVIVTVFNNVRTIGEALDSVLSQTQPPGEIVVIDDGSTDGSGDVARSFAGSVRVLGQENRGISASRNRGVEQATGSLIASVDADDRWALHKLERQLELLSDGVEAVGCLVAQVPDSDWQEVVHEGHRPGQILRGPLWQTLLLRREAFERIGGFDTRYRLAEQVDWWTRAQDASLRLVTVEEPLIFRRLHADNHGVRQRSLRGEYAQAVAEALRRRRAGSGPAA